LRAVVIAAARPAPAQLQPKAPPPDGTVTAGGEPLDDGVCLPGLEHFRWLREYPPGAFDWLFRRGARR
jgi:hypothetical protein